MKWWPLLALSIPLYFGCGDSPQGPHYEFVPAPIEFIDLIPKLDWEQEPLAQAAEALSRADTLAAAEALLNHFTANPPYEAPHGNYSNPVASADELMAGTLTLPTHAPVELAENPTWAEDPLGDVNWRYQYHTLRWTVPLLQAFQETGDRDYLNRLLFLLRDYMADNLVPDPPSDMTWYDMGASLRLEHLIYYWRHLLLEHEVDIDLMFGFLGWFYVHAEMLSHEITYLESSNHGTFHNRSLIVAGLGVPVFLSSSDWFDLGYARVELQFIGMVSSYGVQVEQSPSYHFMQYSLSRSIRNALEQGGASFSAAVESILEGMPVFAAHILQPDTEVPMLSDTPADILAPAYMNRHPLMDFSISQGAEGEHPGERFLSYPETGYVIFRSGWGETRPFVDECFAVFDTGPKGGWHGHYDALTFTLYGHGEKLVVDSGYYTFNSDSWRSYFLSPAAHNLLIDANWPTYTPPQEPQRLVWRTGEDWAYQSAITDLSPGRDWTRHFVWLDPGDVILLDFVYGGDADPRLLLHFAPDADVQQEGSRLHLDVGSAHLDVFPASNPPLELIEGREDPRQCWYSKRYGILETNVVASYGGGRGLEFMTILHPHDGSDPLQDFRLLGGISGEYYRFAVERASGNEEVIVWTATGEVIRTPY